MTVELLVRDEKIVRIETTEFDRVVDFDDIVGSIKPDDWTGETPWDNYDGWDHEFSDCNAYSHDDAGYARGYVVGDRNRASGFIEIDDADIVDKWGHTRRDGESKQVWLERVARVKRDALEQLVDWYSNGWSCLLACADHGDYTDSVGGIYDDIDSDYIKEMVLECRLEVASRMESDGYIIQGKPERVPYNRIDAFKARIRHNLNGA